MRSLAGFFKGAMTSPTLMFTTGPIQSMILAAGMARAESDGNPLARGGVGEEGVYQFASPTAWKPEDVTASDWRKVPEPATEAAIDYLDGLAREGAAVGFQLASPARGYVLARWGWQYGHARFIDAEKTERSDGEIGVNRLNDYWQTSRLQLVGLAVSMSIAVIVFWLFQQIAKMGGNKDWPYSTWYQVGYYYFVATAIWCGIALLQSLWWITLGPKMFQLGGGPAK